MGPSSQVFMSNTISLGFELPGWTTVAQITVLHFLESHGVGEKHLRLHVQYTLQLLECRHVT